MEVCIIRSAHIQRVFVLVLAHTLTTYRRYQNGCFSARLSILSAKKALGVSNWDAQKGTRFLNIRARSSIGRAIGLHPVDEGSTPSESMRCTAKECV